MDSTDDESPCFGFPDQTSEAGKILLGHNFFAQLLHPKTANKTGFKILAAEGINERER